MKKVLYGTLLAGLIAIFAQSAFAADVTSERTVKQTGKPAVVSVTTTTKTVEIIEVDQVKRTVKFKTPEGELTTFKADKRFKNLAQLQAGDLVKGTEVDRVSIWVKAREKGGKSQPSHKQTYSITPNPKGSKPGFTAVGASTTTGTVQWVNLPARKIAVAGPGGKRRVQWIAADVKNLNTLKAGIMVMMERRDTVPMYAETPAN